MSDEIQAWLKKNGVSSVEEARGEVCMADLSYIEPGSEMDSTIRAEADGQFVRLFDLYGWSARFQRNELLAHIKEHGRLATWDDFALLGTLNCIEEE
jgi:hypothetical protein